MDIKGPVTRKEIDAKLASVGDYVKLDYLTRCLKQSLDFDTRKFVLTKLGEIYGNRGMYLEAARMVGAAAEINTTFQAKINDYIRAAELFIKGGAFDDADTTFNKAVACSNGLQKESIKSKRKELYTAQAKHYIQRDKRSQALLAYEKLLTIDLSPEEKRHVQSTLLDLYEKLGKIKDYYSLKRNMSLS
jgi:tetratricopeptide (TPR) repeat protein